MQDITLTLTLEEAVALTNLVGSLPTAQGAYPLFQKLKSQVEPHLPNHTEEKQGPLSLGLSNDSTVCRRPPKALTML